jgi:hypothetical protein
MEENLNSRFDCFKQLLIDTDSSYNAERPKGQMQIFYKEFLRLKNSRDSIVNIKERLTKDDWINILIHFSVKAINLKGSERAKEKIEKDLRLIQANKGNIPESEFGELYKHIIERWIGETYKSVLSNAAIDFVEGYRPPCTM